MTRAQRKLWAELNIAKNAKFTIFLCTDQLTFIQRKIPVERLTCGEKLILPKFTKNLDNKKLKKEKERLFIVLFFLELLSKFCVCCFDVFD